jgi:hypothetical protein
MLTGGTGPQLGNEQGERALELGAPGQFDAVRLGLSHKLRQPIGSQCLT